ncbi:MAG: hypothetical protein IKP73_01145 [Bacteroidales bacterium]|nr:hypothetical protein [Bacteroidales bacterium]
MEVKKITGDIVRIAYDELSRNYIYEKNHEALDKRVQVVSINDIDDYLKCDNIEVFGVSRLHEGQILMRHPFAINTYVDASSSQVELFQDKVNIMGFILQRMGVKSIKGQAQYIESKKREFGVNGNVGVNYVGIDVGFGASYQNAQSQRDFSSIQIHKEYPNAQLTQELYLQAVATAKQYGLYNDRQINSLIKSRNPELGSNVQGRERISVELSNEYNELTDIAFTLNAMEVFKLGGGYKENIETVNTVKIDLDITF